MGVSLGHLREQDGASCERSGSPGDKGERFRKRVSASKLEHTELEVLHADRQSGRAVLSATVNGRDVLKEVSEVTRLPCERPLRQLSDGGVADRWQRWWQEGGLWVGKGAEQIEEDFRETVSRSQA